MRQPQAPFYDPRQHQSNGASGERYIHLQLHKQKQILTLGYIQNGTSPERQRCRWDLAVERVIWVPYPPLRNSRMAARTSGNTWPYCSRGAFSRNAVK